MKQLIKLQNNSVKFLVYFVFFAFFVFFFARGLLLIYPDLNLTYPFLSSDSYDWIANGLHYAGYNVDFSFRPIGLPLLIALLEKINLLNFLPFFNQTVLFLILVFLYKTVRIFLEKIPSLLATILFFFNFFLQNMSLYILADIYAVLFIVIGTYFYLKARENQKHYIWASLFWSLSFWFQYAFAYFAVGALLHFLIYRRKINFKFLGLSLIFPLLFIAGLLIYKEVAFGSFFYSGVNHASLFIFHLDSIGSYLINVVAVLGIIPFIIFLISFVKLGKKLFLKENELVNFSLVSMAAWILFWVFLYDWNDRRFVVYLIPFLFAFLAIGLADLLKSFKIGGYFKKVAVAFIFLAAVWNTSLPYKSFLALNTLKITEKLSIKFGTSFNESTHNSNIILSSFSLEKGHDYPNALNLMNLNRNRSGEKNSEIENIQRISNLVKEKNLAIVCTRLDNGIKWYSTKNKYGNALKIKLLQYPKCSEPLIHITNKGLKSIL